MTRHTPTTDRHRCGFTFVELSITIVIIGLVAGSILVGRDLVTHAEIRVVGRELARYESAYITFKDKYNALPGDMANAHVIWGSAVANDGLSATCQNTPSDTTATCSGNSNGVIMSSAVAQDETHRAWQHMKNAGLIEGRFVGSTNGLTAGQLINLVVPASRANGAGYQFFSESKGDQGWTNAPEAGSLQAIRVAAAYSGGDAPVRLGDNIFSPYQAFSIDEKIDDGRPGLGKVFVHANAAINCITNKDALTSEYTPALDTIGCFLHYDLTK